MNKKILASITLGALLAIILILPMSAFAVGSGAAGEPGGNQGGGNGQQTTGGAGDQPGNGGGGGSPTIQGMVDAAVNVALYIASGIVVILWLITGILFLTAQGAPEKLSTAKKSLFAAVAGTVLVIVASGAVSLVKGALNI